MKNGKKTAISNRIQPSTLLMMAQKSVHLPPTTRTFAYGLAFLLGIAWVISIYPGAFIAGQAALFETSDPSQHLTGWLAFAADTWHLPLLHTSRLNAPEGVVIAFTDSIPLAALLFRPFVDLLPAHFHYLGIWQAIAMVSQAMASVWLIRGMGQRSLWAATVAALFGLFSPSLSYRVFHTSLMTHSLVLIAIGIYWRAVTSVNHGWAHARFALQFTLLSAISLLIHPYFTAMVIPFYMALLIDTHTANRQRPKPWFTVALCLSLTLGCITTVGWLAGHFTGGAVGRQGFGHFSMDLTAPFCGGLLDCPVHQYEGYNYLGLGALMLLALAIVTAVGRSVVNFNPDSTQIHCQNRSRLLRLIWRLQRRLGRHPALVIMLVLLTMFALSNQIRFGTTLLIDIPMASFLSKVANTFRSSGRFFWPVGYVVVFWALAKVLANRRWWIQGLLCCAVLLQWFDTAQARSFQSHAALTPPAAPLFPWQRLANRIDRVALVAPFQGPATWNAVDFSSRLATFLEVPSSHVRLANYLNLGMPKASTPHWLTPRTLVVIARDKRQDGFIVDPAIIDKIDFGQCVGSPRYETAFCLAGYDLQRWHLVLPDAVPFAPTLGQTTFRPLAPKGQQAKPYLVGPFPKSSPWPEFYLSSGKYELELVVESPYGSETRVGTWDLFTHSQDSIRGPIQGTRGEKVHTRHTFLVPKSADRWPLGVKIYLNGDGPLRLHEFTLRSLPDSTAQQSSFGALNSPKLEHQNFGTTQSRSP